MRVNRWRWIFRPTLCCSTDLITTRRSAPAAGYIPASCHHPYGRAEYLKTSHQHYPPRAVAAFSSGVDSTFTLARHTHDRAGRARRDIRTAVLIHGFDMPLDAEDGFETLSSSALAICQQLGIDPGHGGDQSAATHCQLEMTFGAGLASVLHQFDAAHDLALIATEESYQNCFPVWATAFGAIASFLRRASQ